MSAAEKKRLFENLPDLSQVIIIIELQLQ